MKKYLICIFLSAFIIIYSSMLYAEVPENQQNKIWSELVEAKTNPASSKLAKWSVIENIELIRKSDSASVKATALAVIIIYYNKKNEIWFGAIDSKKKFPKIQAMLEGEDWKSEKNGVKLLTHLNELKDELFSSQERFSARLKHGLTFGMDMSDLLDEKYFKRNKNDISLAVKDFAANRGMDVEVTVRNDMRFDELADLIDKQNPVILQVAAADNYLICVGYIMQGTEKYLITADPNKIMIEEYSHADKILKSMERKEGLAKRDMKIKITNDLQPGMEISDWKSGKYTAFIIRNFDVTEASFEKYLNFIKSSPDILIWPSFGAKEFKKQVGEWIPLGTSVSDAERIMKGKEFNCRRRTETATKYYAEYEELSCERYGPDLIGARQRWNVHLTIKDGKIAEVGTMSGGY
jgi:hypothetical protein